MKKLPLGIMDFEELILNDYFFIDKTSLIEEFLERKTKVTLITRPRRFGKTLNMSMLAEFLDITKDSKRLFENTKIMHSPYANHINQYPTIFISFLNAKGNKQSVIKNVKNAIYDEYERFEYIFDNMSTRDSRTYNKIINCFESSDASLFDANDSIHFLMKMLNKYYGKRVMVIFDEFDTPFIEAYNGEFYDDIINDLSSLFSTALKEKDYLQYGMITGIQRVAKENIFSGLNNLVICDVTSKFYDDCFGFTEEEVKNMFEYYNIEFNVCVKEMYDGYLMGSKEIYNPWSILNYCDTNDLKAHWIHTSSNALIRKLLKESSYIFKKDYETLLEKGYLDTIVDLNTSFHELKTDESLWGLFVSSGYLTLEELSNDKYRLRIPNNEVIEEFKSITSDYLDVSNTQINRLMESLKNKDKDVFIDMYESILMIPSYHDLLNENSYHMLSLGMSLWLMQDFEIISNREKGKGRCDIILKAKHPNLASYILEFKYSNSNSSENLEELAKNAVEQIKTQGYGYNLSGDVVYIGLAHHGKDCFILWQEQ